jgi:hypothetical protein
MNTFSSLRVIALWQGLLLLVTCLAVYENCGASEAKAKAGEWRGIHLLVRADSDLDQLEQRSAELAKLGVNTLILEVNYNFEFKSHPELRNTSAISRARASEFTRAARAKGIRVIPQFSCLGHQSWAKTTFPLLTRYPEFDETPGQFPNNESIYCRSWCPQHPGLNKVVLALIDELIDAFAADAFHVGMDEVFLIASEHCRRCKGADPAKLFSRAVNDLHGHLVAKRKVEMLMWGDRLLDAKALDYSKWEAADNGTQGAIGMIPKDIIICEWHYEKREAYPSVPLLLKEGFRVWPAGWKDASAAVALAEFAAKHAQPRMLGYLCTTWGAVKINDLPSWAPLVQPLKRVKG